MAGKLPSQQMDYFVVFQEVPISRVRFANWSKKKKKKGGEIAVLECGLEWMLCFASVTVAIIFQSEVICELLEV